MAQKGTGRARQGSIRAPQWVGGGTVFGPHTRSYDQKVNKKEIKLAMRSALSAKVADGQFTVVDELDFEKPCTKDAKAFIKALGLEGQRTTLVIGNDDVTTGFPVFPQHPRGEHSAGGRYQHLRAGRQQAAGYRRAEALKRIEEVLRIMKDPREVIIRPIVTEHSYDQMENNVYTFEGGEDSNKVEIRQAIEAIFNVKVVKVNT